MHMNKVIRIWNYEFYVKELLVLLFTFLLMENIFSWLVLPVSVIVLAYEKITTIIIFAFMLYRFKDLQLMEKAYMGIFTVLMIKLVFESLTMYGSFFERLTMFSILFPVVFAMYVKYLCRSLQLNLLPFLARFYLYLYVVFMVIYGRGFSFSLNEVDMQDYGPFSGDSRIIHARSIFMLIIPVLYYFNKFINQRHYKSFIPFAICFGAILIHQHRSVWASAMVALIVFFFAGYRNGFIPAYRLVKTSLVTLVGLVGIWFIVSSSAPKFTDLFLERSSEIFNPTREGGTGEFREQQRLVYFQYVLQRPIFGWTFEGFDMPNPLVDWWPEKTGQHFHEGYMEMLFYHGIVGLLFKYSLLLYLCVKAFSKKLTQESVILIAFSVSGLVFSFSYVLPLVFWGVVGICLYYLELQPLPPDEEEGELNVIIDEEPGSPALDEHQQPKYLPELTY